MDTTGTGVIVIVNVAGAVSTPLAVPLNVKLVVIGAPRPGTLPMPALASDVPSSPPPGSLSFV